MRFSQSAAEPDSEQYACFSAHAQATLLGTPNQPITWDSSVHMMKNCDLSEFTWQLVPDTHNRF